MGRIILAVGIALALVTTFSVTALALGGSSPPVPPQTTVPEPSTLLLLGGGLVLAARGLRKRKRT